MNASMNKISRAEKRKRVALETKKKTPQPPKDCTPFIFLIAVDTSNVSPISIYIAGVTIKNINIRTRVLLGTMVAMRMVDPRQNHIFVPVGK